MGNKGVCLKLGCCVVGERQMLGQCPKQNTSEGVRRGQRGSTRMREAQVWSHGSKTHLGWETEHSHWEPEGRGLGMKRWDQE